jgi:hypothetical protein
VITIVFGAPGVGKSALMTHFIKKVYIEEGAALLDQTQAKIEELNRSRDKLLTFPDKPPIFSDYRVKFKVGYEKYYEPYFVNGFYLGLPNDRINTIYLPPYSKVFLSEVQRYYDSRKSKSTPDFISRMYEMHRHYGIDVYMDIQRPMLIDLNIRELCKRFIEVVSMVHTTDYTGEITKTMFHCREFDSWRALETYMENGTATYTDRAFVNEGNIFRCFNSFNYFDEFLPKDGKDFNYLPFLSRAEREGLSAEKKAFYDQNEPKGYRGDVKEKEKSK